jgi:Flp pilus assembly protein TadG
MMFESIAKKLSEEDGSELVEFAISICLWTSAAFALMYGAFALYVAHFVANASDEAARYAVVRGSSWNGASCSTGSGLDCSATATDISNFVANSLPPGLSAAGLTVATTWPGTTSSGNACDTQNGTNSPNCVVDVQVQYNFNFPVPFLPQGSFPIASASQMTISE